MAVPSAISGLINPSDVTQVENLELLSTRVIDGILSGRHQSKLKGGSAEFAEHRAYAPGDEIRQIDWKVFGKSDRYYVKQFIEQTCLQTLVVLDASGSMRFGLSSPPKFDYARALAVCLTRLVLKQSDAAGVAVVDSDLRAYVPPRSTPNHFQSLLAELKKAEPKGETSLADNLQKVLLRIKRRGLVILLSDCFDDIDHLSTVFRMIRSRGHDIILFHIMAPEELTFEFTGWSRFRCLEQLGIQVDLDPAFVRKEYLENIRHFLTRLKQTCGELGCDYVPRPTDKPLARIFHRESHGMGFWPRFR